jgi:hypothetical protein
MDLLIQVKDTEAPFLIELLRRFDFVKIKQTEVPTEDSAILKGLEVSLQQMKAMRAGKLPKPTINDLFGDE